MLVTRGVVYNIRLVCVLSQTNKYQEHALLKVPYSINSPGFYNEQQRCTYFPLLFSLALVTHLFVVRLGKGIT